MEQQTDSLDMSTGMFFGPLHQDFGSLSSSVLPEAQVVQNVPDLICRLSDRVFRQELKHTELWAEVRFLRVSEDQLVSQINQNFSMHDSHFRALWNEFQILHGKISSLDPPCESMLPSCSLESVSPHLLELEVPVLPVACEDATFILDSQDEETPPLLDQTSEEGKEGQEVVRLVPLRIPKLASGTTTPPSSSPKAHASSSHNNSKSQVRVPMCWLCGKEGHEKKSCPRGHARK